MKRTILLALAALVCVTAFADDHADLIPGAISVRPANSIDGKILTLDEAMNSRELSNFMMMPEWVSNGKGYEPVKSGNRMRRDPREMQDGLQTVSEGNSLYLRCEDGSLKPIAIAENSNIVYGQSVSRNEFGINGGVFVAPDKSKIAFYRKDESAVTEFPLLNIKSRTGELMAQKYPMAGMDSEVLRLCVYDVASGDTLHVKATDFGADRYLTNITWSPDSKNIFIQVLDRTQKHCNLNMYDAATGDYLSTILTDESSKYVEPLDPLYFIEGSNDTFIYRTAVRDGFRNLYLCTTAGSVKRLTCVDADVDYLCNDGKYVYYMSSEVSPAEKHLCRVEIKSGKMKRLTEAEGVHRINFSPDKKQFMDYYTSLCNPGTLELRSADGKLVKVLDQAADPTLNYAYGEMILGSVPSADGLYENHYRLILPYNFDPSKKYPLILYVYGGPHSQQVNNSFLAQLRRWEMYMAMNGYIVYIQDNRGTQYHGLAYEQAIHRQCGQCEMADQMVGINMLKSLPFGDSDRIGVHGWSYGGFMTTSLITNYPDVFKVAVAGGPVIDWQWYEVMYGERYMDTPQSNPEGFAKTSLINKAKNLEGKLLIIQGAVDETVVWQHCLSFIQEAINNGRQVDFFAFPTAQHNMVGRERTYLHEKISDYFFRNL